MTEAEVRENEIGTFIFLTHIPEGHDPNDNQFWFNPIDENGEYILDNHPKPNSPSPAELNFTLVGPEKWRAEFETITSWSQPLVKGNYYTVTAKFKNVGTGTWGGGAQGNIKLGSGRPSAQNVNNDISHDSWFAPTRPTFLQEDFVAPGQSGTFRFLIEIPEDYDQDPPPIYTYSVVANGSNYLYDANGDESFAGLRFTVTELAKSISIFEPGGGDTWYRGTSHAIQWTDEGYFFSDQLKLDLVYGSSTVAAPISTATDNDGYFKFT
ncbi:MAG: hypothetical protein AAFQ98_14360, partial [Bacteroidota bacterium]